jgi:hypothetical protein
MIATTKTRTWREGGGVWGFDGESEAMEREKGFRKEGDGDEGFYVNCTFL